jgi:ribosome biogenesis protein NSA2
MKKMIKAHEQKSIEVKVDEKKEGAVPAYLLDRENINRSKVLSNTVKQKRKEKAGKWAVPI